MQKNHSFKTILLESFFILVSILLAFLLNDWREKSNKEQLYQEVILNVKAELENNLAQLEKTVPQQLELLKALQSYIKDPKSNFSEGSLFSQLLILAPTGMRTPLLNDAAWEFASQSGLFSKNVHLHYTLSSIYKQQNIGVNSTIPRITNFIMQEKNFSKNQDVKAAFSLLNLLVTEIIGQERSLEKRYKEVLEEFDKELTKNDDDE